MHVAVSEISYISYIIKQWQGAQQHGKHTHTHTVCESDVIFLATGPTWSLKSE